MPFSYVTSIRGISWACLWTQGSLVPLRPQGDVQCPKQLAHKHNMLPTETCLHSLPSSSQTIHALSSGSSRLQHTQWEGSHGTHILSHCPVHKVRLCHHHQLLGRALPHSAHHEHYMKSRKWKGREKRKKWNKVSPIINSVSCKASLASPTPDPNQNQHKLC